MSKSHPLAKTSTTTPHDNKSNVSNVDFKTMMMKKHKELKSSVIRGLIKKYKCLNPVRISKYSDIV